MCGVTGVHTASIHPGPTCGQGTSPMARSVPSATAGVAAGVVAGAAVAAGAFGLDCAAIEFADDEQPVSNSDAAATMPRPARQALARVETCFKTVPFVNVG